MANYAVGDIQGCLEPLRHLLDQVAFDPTKDCLWPVGDIVNRGPASLETMRFLKTLGSACNMVLGNHDLHLLAIYHGVRAPTSKDTLNEILNAPDADTLCAWLQQQPLIRRSADKLLVHAGIPSIWSVEQALSLAKEVETVLAGPEATLYFENMYGDTPELWSDQLQGPTRWRVITNYLTRMRFCDADGRLDLNAKGPAEAAPEGYAPWFSFAVHRPVQILFGHWASLQGQPVSSQLCALDTGYVWGGALRLLDMDTGGLFHWPG